MALIPPFFIDAVVAIGYENQKQDNIFWGASGFFYLYPLKKDKGRVYLITNKHVVDGQKKIFLRINPKASGKPKGYLLNLEDPVTGEKVWRGHYLKKVDVAVIPINFNLLQQENMQVNFFNGLQHALDMKSIKDKGLCEGDGVFVLGFPVSLVGDRSNSVIVRGGNIARIRDSLFHPQESFLIDTTVFPGNSGGPVINKPETISIQGTTSVSSANLIGIIASYTPYRDVAVSKQTGNIRVIFEENSGLSSVFSVDCIRSVINAYEKSLKKSMKLAEPEPSQEASEENHEI